ncbi:putative DNA topoisomerase type IB small subunit [Trypanosoma vivax]|nr:putative DNA topoisomerase type IB small subunit [Trypanosoma vivax]
MQQAGTGNGSTPRGAPTLAPALPPAKVPIKMPHALPKLPLPHVPVKGTPPSLSKETSSDKEKRTASTMGPAKKRKTELMRRMPLDIDTSSSSSGSGNESSGQSDGSSSSSLSRSRSGSNSRSTIESEIDESSSVARSATSTPSGSDVPEEELTLFQIAMAQGLVGKTSSANDPVLEEEAEENTTVGPPPRPPVVRSFPRDIEAAVRRYEERLNREENMIRIKDDNKTVSLGTSKINYIDPRIVCSWAREHNVPISKIFSATIQKKFPWAMGAENFSF